MRFSYFSGLRDGLGLFYRAERRFLPLLAMFVGLNGSAEQLSISTIAGTGTPGTVDGTNRASQLYAPAPLAWSSGTNLFLFDGHALRRLALISSNWVLTTIAGDIKIHGAADGTNLIARFNQPEGIAVDSANNLLVADTVNNSIRKVIPSGTNWVATTFAGLSGSASGFLDGTNSGARFNHPYGILTAAGGAVFVADTYNHTIRKIVTIGTNNIVTTIAGAVGIATTTDGTNTNAHFNGPVALAADASGAIYVADLLDLCIRKMTPVGTNWVVTTIAGQPGLSGSTDGTNRAALFEGPSGLVVDIYGRIYVTDGSANVIRKIRVVGTNYVVSTVAGTAGVTGTNDGVGPAAEFNGPAGITLDGMGGIYIVDGMNFTVRLGRVAALLEFTRLNNQFALSWPVDAADFTLSCRSSISGGNWLPILSGWVTNGDTCVYTPSTTSGSAFYRLQKP